MIDKTVKNLPVLMYRYSLTPPEGRELPAGYHFAYYQDGYEKYWAEIECSVGQFDREEDALSCFAREFQPREELYRRGLFVFHESGACVGIATAWFEGKLGRVHWVAVAPSHQKRGIATALVTRVIEDCFRLHGPGTISLHSGTPNHNAIRIYRRLGFQPYLRNQSDIEAWDIIDKANGDL